MADEFEHLGFKTFYLYIGWLLAAVVILFDVLFNWVPATTITLTMVSKLLIIAATFSIGVPVVFYIAHVMWMLAYKVEEKLKPEAE